MHRVPDYSGATKEEREQLIADIIAIAHTWGYNAIFAGYGFMAEDEQMVAAMEGAADLMAPAREQCGKRA